MAFITLTSLRRASFAHARTLPSSAAKVLRKEIWGDIRAQYGIPRDVELATKSDDINSTDFQVLVKKGTQQRLLLGSDGRFAGVEPVAPQAPAVNATPSPSAGTVTPVAQVGTRFHRISLAKLRELLGDHGDTYAASFEGRSDDFQVAMDGADLLIRA